MQAGGGQLPGVPDLQATGRNTTTLSFVVVLQSCRADWRVQVAGPRWAEHRRECYMRHAVVLSKLPACDIKVDTKLQCAPCYCVPQCPTCRVRLKLWQLNIGEQSFTCADTGHGCAQYGGYTTNTGRNWSVSVPL